VGKYYSYVVEAIDEEGNALMFNANLPAWLTITDQFDGTALVLVLQMKKILEIIQSKFSFRMVVYLLNSNMT
jgi:hypothetical protein